MPGAGESQPATSPAVLFLLLYKQVRRYILSSIIAGSVLLLKGTRFDELIEKISKARGLKVPDTAEQVKWLKERS